MIRLKYILCLLLLLFPAGMLLSATTDPECDERVVPLPVHELKEVLSLWWERAGFEVRRSKPAKEVIRLNVSMGNAAARFDLSPQSAIAAKIKTKVTENTGSFFSSMDGWWRYLSLYIQGSTTETFPVDPTIPVPVLTKIESVVCIRAATGEEKDRFSGVILDSAGLIISTAHGIQENQEILITLYDGRELRGAFLHRDLTLDLALIQIQGSALEAVSLVDGRNLLGMGEQVFSIGCVGDLQGTVITGVINSPPRRVDDQPLWQVNMEIQPGNSGSPVFDKQGAFVALVKGRYLGTSSVGFLIPLETIIHFLKASNPL